MKVPRKFVVVAAAILALAAAHMAARLVSQLAPADILVATNRSLRALPALAVPMLGSNAIIEGTDFAPYGAASNKVISREGSRS